MTRLELLAPARDEAMGIAAVNCGADAVYVGAPRFSARAAAGTSVEAIGRLARYAHRYHARVYAALNTILFDDELEEACRIITQLYHAGIDALIIQDMGILEMELPPVPLHASTQVHNATPEKVRFLEKAGFSRVILARELTLEQIAHISKETSVELEAFVHGALCVSVSGRCYMSQALGERSGNRGVCAQPCRKPWNLVDARGEKIITGKHLLSLRDLDLSDHLPELAMAGITSFKIEGRLKDESYLRNVTAWYRQKLDAFLEGNPAFGKSSSGRVLFDFKPDPARTFSRGSSSYFLQGRHAGMTSMDTPKSAGERVGVVVRSEGRQARIKAEKELHNNDGITFFTGTGVLGGVKINTVEGDLITWAEPVNLPPGTVLYRNYDHRFEEQLRSSRTSRKIGLKITLEETPGGIGVTGTDEDGISLSMVFPVDYTPARDTEQAARLFREQFSRAGETPFEVTTAETHGKWSLFMPQSRINALRREFLDAFTAHRENVRPVEVRRIGEEDVPYQTTSLSWSENVSNALADRFYRRHGVREIEPAMEVTRDYRGRRLMTMKHCLKYQLGHCPREKKAGQVTGVPSPLPEDTGSAAFPRVTDNTYPAGTTAMDAFPGEKVSPGAAEASSAPWKEPLYLSDGKRKFRLEFNCRECTMNLYHL